MATKTISIDLEAYERLKKVQKEDESFSQTIKRVIRQPYDFKAVLAYTAEHPMSDDAVAAIEQVIADRRRGLPKSTRRGR